MLEQALFILSFIDASYKSWQKTLALSYTKKLLPNKLWFRIVTALFSHSWANNFRILRAIIMCWYCAACNWTGLQDWKLICICSIRSFLISHSVGSLGILTTTTFLSLSKDVGFVFFWAQNLISHVNNFNYTLSITVGI